MKKLIFALTCTIVAVTFAGSAFAAFINLDANGQPTSVDADCVMIKDDVSNLIWEKKTSLNKGDTYTWDDAKAYVDTLGGDWRLPTIQELLTIVDFTKASAPTSYLADMNIYPYWTSTEYAPESYNHTYFWMVNFSAASNAKQNKTMPTSVIAVKGGSSPSPDFTSDNAQNIVTDNNTKLVWQNAPAALAKTWDQASAYCATLLSVQVGGKYYGWRMPTLQELRSIVNYGRYYPDTTSPAIYADFFSASSSPRIWTYTSSAQNSSKAWYIDFTDGSTGTIAKTSSYLVWAVLDTSKEVDPPPYPLGDINHDLKVDLADVIAGLRVLDGIPVTVYTDKEVNADFKIGQEEVIYALQITAALRIQ